MLNWETLRFCHQRVPVRYWPVLWFYLACLKLTLDKAWAEGRDGVIWSLKWNGVIYIKFWGESTAERGGLPADFDRAPWTRLSPQDLGELGALFRGEPAIALQSAWYRPGSGQQSAALNRRACHQQLALASCLHPP